MKKSGMVALAAVILASALWVQAQDKPRGMAFKDIMGEMGTNDPTMTWDAYHDMIACADFDKDGDVDILVVPRAPQQEPVQRHRAHVRQSAFRNRKVQIGGPDGESVSGGH